MVNNVCHVGHAHPRVVRAAAEQMARLNTNTRYLHDTIVTYARRLAAVERARHAGVLLSTDGPRRNVIKLKPPLVIGDDDAGRLLDALAAALG